MKNLETLKLTHQLLKQGQYSRAEYLLHQLVISGHRSAEAFYLQGVLYQEQNNLKQAKEYYEKSLELDENYIKSLSALSIFLNDIGDYKNGAIYFKKALAAQEIGMQSETRVDHLVKQDISEKHFQMALMYKKQKQWNESIKELENSLKQNPQYEKAVIELAVCLKNTGKSEKAIRYLEMFVSEHEKAAVASRICLGDLLCEKGLFQEGIRQWEKAAQLNSELKEVKDKLKSYPNLPVEENLITD